MTYHSISPEQNKEDIRMSAIRREQKTDQVNNVTCCILSFDSSPFNNGIVNVLFAAELEKLTHRPINHMFDLICGKNESACIASCLSLFKRDEDVGSTILDKHYRPEFRAIELLPEYNKLVLKLDTLLYLKKSSFK